MIQPCRQFAARIRSRTMTSSEHIREGFITFLFALAIPLIVVASILIVT
jgi:hypothetical protein